MYKSNITEVIAMEICRNMTGQTLTVALRGELDHHAAEQTRNTIDLLINELRPTELVLDLSGVTFMDSSGLGVVLGRYRLLSTRGGKMYITGAQGIGGKICTAMKCMWSSCPYHKMRAWLGWL